MEFLPITKITLEIGILRFVESLAFAWFPNLVVLDMSFSQDMSLADMFPAWFGLQKTRVEILRFNYFNSINDNDVYLNKTFFAGLSQLPSLREIQFDGSRIVEMDIENWPTLVNLEYISIAYNMMSDTNLCMLSHSLRKNQKITYFDASYQTRCSEPKRLPYAFKPPGEPIVVLCSELFFETFYLSPALKLLNVSGNRFSVPYVVKRELIVSQNNSLEYFIFRDNSIQEFKDQIRIASPNNSVLLNVDFSRNKLIKLNPDLFIDSIQDGLRIGGLILSENSFTGELASETFNYYEQMQHLDLSMNRIDSLPFDVFKNQTRLEVLNLSSNVLTSVTFDFFHMHNLQMLDLSNNPILRIGTNVQAKLEELKLISRNLSVDMSKISFQCSCDYTQFLRWMLKNTNLFLNFNRYSCVYHNGITSFDALQTTLDKLDFDCAVDPILKTTAGLLAFLIVVVAGSIFLYRHRWDVRFLCVKFIVKRNEYQALMESEVYYEYDAFVAYHKTDLKWVTRELLENLGQDEYKPRSDDESRFRFCIHDKNFIPGITIQENIVRAIENSRKTILVLSTSFLKSGWCEFELQMARLESFNKKKNLIVAVMLEPLSEDSMSSSLKMLIRKNTYIEWFDGATGKENFWEKMKSALRSEAEGTLVCECGQTFITQRSRKSQ